MAETARRYVYGLHAVRALIAERPQAIIAVKLLDRPARERLVDIAQALTALGLPVERVRRAELDRLCGGGAHQGVVVETRAAPEFTLGELEALVLARGRALRLLVLDSVQDPRNLGACLRTADAAGVDALIIPKARAAGLTAAARKAATGAAETVPVLRAPNLARTLRWLKEAGVWVVGTEAGAGRPVYEAALATPIAMVVGGEGQGLRRLTRELCDELVSIPMHGTVASLNVSVAVGIVLFELLRQAPRSRDVGAA